MSDVNSVRSERTSFDSWKRSIRGTLSTGSGIAAGQAATGLSLLIIARRSSLDRFGLFAAVFAATYFLGGMLDFGSSQCQTRALARGIGREEFRSWLLKRSLMQAPASAAFTIGLIVFLHGRLPILSIVGLGLQSLTFPISTGALAAVRALKSPAVASWFIAGGNVVLVVAALASPSTTLFSTCGVAAAVSWSLTAWWAIASTKTLVGRGASLARSNPWRGASRFGLFSLAVALQGLDVVVIGGIAGSVTAGKLAAVTKWEQPIALIAGAYSSYAFPGLTSRGSHRSAIRSLRPLAGLVALGTAMVGGAIVLAPWLVSTFLGSRYSGSVSLLRLSLLGSLLVLVAQPLAVLLQARDHEHFVAVATVTVKLLAVLAVLLLADVLGASVSPLAAGASTAILAALFVLRARRLWLSEGPGGSQHSPTSVNA